MKKIIYLITIILIIAIGIIIYFTYKNPTKNVIKNNDTVIDNNSQLQSKKIIVVYFSAQNHTKNIATKIANNLNADIFEIIPKEIYTSDDLNWSDNNSRVSKEHNNENLRNVELLKAKIENFEDYDTVLIGYPIWWGIAAWPVNSFVKDNNFDGKTVIPFCTSASSDIGQSGELLKKDANGGNWKSGYRFSSNASDHDIKEFTDSIIK